METDITYQQFIDKIIKERGRFGCGEEYHERHHIIPRCIGGTNNKTNLIDLYAREHFIAHKLLAKENPNNSKLQCAWWMMAHIRNSKRMSYECTPEEYEEARTAFSKKFSGEGHPLWGKHHTKESIQKMKEHTIPLRGESNPFYGRHHTEESKRKMSEKRLGTHLTEEQKQKISESTKGKVFSEETRRKLSEAHKGRPSRLKGTHLTEETKKKISEAQKGDKGYWYGKHFSEETRKRMSESHKGCTFSKETREKIGKANSIPIICVETNELFPSIAEVERKLNLNHSNLVACLKGRQKTCGGYHWAYASARGEDNHNEK